MISKKADALKRFVSVTDAAWAYIRKGHEDEAVKALIADREHAKLDPALLLAQIRSFEDFMMTPATKKPAHRLRGSVRHGGRNR